LYFPTCIWINAIWLSISITLVFTSKCVSTTMGTLGFDISLITILGFFGL
jgi:hypothetical protein